MLSSIVFGQFIPGESLLHRLDPRTKIGIVLAGSWIALAAVNWQGYSLTFACVAAGILGSGFKSAIFYRVLKPFWLILALTFLLQVFLTPGNPLFFLAGLRITAEGLAAGGQIFFRLSALIIVAALLTLTTPPIKLTAGLEAIFAPLRKLGLPAHEIAMMMSIALRFVPTLFIEAQLLVKAQRSRGAGMTGGFLARAGYLLPLLVPLFARVIRRAEELGEAMEARCYRPGANRTRLFSLMFGRADYITLGVSAVSLLAALFFRS